MEDKIIAEYNTNIEYFEELLSRELHGEIIVAENKNLCNFESFIKHVVIFYKGLSESNTISFQKNKTMAINILKRIRDNRIKIYHKEEEIKKCKEEIKSLEKKIINTKNGNTLNQSNTNDTLKRQKLLIKKKYQKKLKEENERLDNEANRIDQEQQKIDQNNELARQKLQAKQQLENELNNSNKEIESNNKKIENLKNQKKQYISRNINTNIDINKLRQEAEAKYRSEYKAEIEKIQREEDQKNKALEKKCSKKKIALLKMKEESENQLKEELNNRLKFINEEITQLYEEKSKAENKVREEIIKTQKHTKQVRNQDQLIKVILKINKYIPLNIPDFEEFKGLYTKYLSQNNKL